MKDLKGLEDQVKEIVATLRPDMTALKKRWLTIGEMKYRTQLCYRPDGTLMTDAEYLAHYEEVCPFETWAAEQIEHQMNPFGKPTQPEGKTKDGHRDLTDIVE